VWRWLIKSTRSESYECFRFTCQGGKPLVDARIEVARAIDGIALAAKELLHVMRGEEIPMGHTEATRGRTAFTCCEPIGVVLAISAFNHPLNLIVHQVIPAVAVGCPVIVDESADLDRAVPSLVKGGFYHAGQVCVSVQRVFSAEAIARKLAEKLAAGAAQLKVGAATAEETEVGPLILPREVDRVHAWVEEAVASGAELLAGGQPLGDTMYQPTVLFDPDAEANISKEEILGPVICVYPYRDRHEAIQRANRLDVAFQAAVYTDSLEVALDTVKRLDASAVMVNDHNAFRADWMPFAGRRVSGYGVGGIGYTMRDMVQTKMTVIKTT